MLWERKECEEQVVKGTRRGWVGMVRERGGGSCPFMGVGSLREGDA